MINILLCEQNEKWLNNFQDKLDANMKLCACVKTGKDAQKTLNEMKIDALIINLETKNYSFFEVIKFVKQKFPKIIILMLVEDGTKVDEYFYSDKDIQKLGINESFKKPFPVYNLIKYISQNFMHQAWKDVLENPEENSNDTLDGKEVSESDRKFSSLRVDKFQHNNVSIFDLYIRLGKNKYVKVFNAGQKIEAGRISKYLDKDKDLRLFFKITDRLSYVNYINELITRRINKEQTSNIEIVKAVESSSILYIEEIFTVGLEEHIVSQAKDVCTNIYESVHRNTDLKNLLKDYLQDEITQEAHIFLTAFYTAIISENVDWVTSHSRTGLIFGALLHDIGKVKLSTKIKGKQKSELNKIELETYIMHPEYGVELLDGIEGVTEQVKQIVYQHHELNDGSGFPNALTGTKIYPLAKIVSFANFLSNKSLNNSLGPFDTVKMAIEERDEIMSFEPFVIKAFIKGFIKDV
mgnify:CR=1 FL=1